MDYAHPVFSRYDAPVTVFVISGFIDGRSWNWWDRVHAACALTDTDFALLRDARGHAFPDGLDPWNAAEQMIASCKEVSDELRRSALAAFEESLAVQLPERPADGCAPMGWDDVRRLSGQGVEFGGHTVTHPILSQVDSRTLGTELSDSLQSVERATSRPTRVFAYPNGRAQDYDDATVAALKRLGVEAAVTTTAGFARRTHAGEEEARYHLPRLSFPEQPERQLALVCGLEAAKDSSRR
jgi:peptidoglycan/xylan/chitin deacetylase (PgdA/CDA1 family)